MDLPEPFGPRKPNTLPRGISNETRSTAVNVPKRRVRLSQREEDVSEEEEEEEDGDFLEGEEGGGEARAGRGGRPLMPQPHVR